MVREIWPAQRGVAARIREKCPKAVYTHCCSHKLNLALVKAMGITAVGNMMDTADKLVRFYNFSPKRQHNLEKCIDDIQDGKTDKVKLKELCRTRWVARYDALVSDTSVLPAVPHPGSDFYQSTLRGRVAPHGCREARSSCSTVVELGDSFLNSLKPVLHFSGAAKVAAVTGAPQIGRAATC